MTDVISKSERVRRAAKTAPYLIPLYMQKFNPFLTKCILYDMLPFRTSLEIECFGSLQWGHIINTGKVLSLSSLKNEYNMVDYSEDRGYTDFEFEDAIKDELNGSTRTCLVSSTLLSVFRSYPEQSLPSLYGSVLKNIPMSERKLQDLKNLITRPNWDAETLNYNEHRLSIANYTGLNGLYKVLNLMKEYCVYNTKAGIHIHVDFSKYPIPDNNLRDFQETKISDAITPLLDEVGHIFRDDITTLTDKSYGSWIRLNKPGDELTIEFRLGDMTFEYETIVDWMIKCNSFVKKLYGLLGIDYKTGKELGSKPKAKIVEKQTARPREWTLILPDPWMA